MTTDRLKQLAIALGVLIVLWGAAEVLGGGFDEPIGGFELPSISVEDVDSVVIARVADTVALVKRDDEDWTVNGHRAADASVSDFFEVLAEGSPGQLIAQSATTHGRLEIDDSTARHMRVFGGDGTLAHLLVGKRGSTFQDTYFRRPGEADVYSVRTSLSIYIDRRIDDWRDRTITSITPDSVASVEVRRARSTYTVRREGDGWVLAGGQPADSAAVARFLRQYQGLNAVGFPTPEQRDSVDLDSPDRRAVVRDLNGSTLLDIVFDSIPGAFLVRRDGDTTVFRLSAFTVIQLTPADSTLRRR